MPLEVCACTGKKVENIQSVPVGLRRHKRLLYHWKLTLRSIEKREPNPARARILLLRDISRLYECDRTRSCIDARFRSGGGFAGTNATGANLDLAVRCQNRSRENMVGQP